MARVYEDMSLILGLQLRPHVESYQTLAAAGASVVEGLGWRQLLTNKVVNRPLSGWTGSEESTQEWQLAALGLGIFDQLVDPVRPNEYSSPDALASYIKRPSGAGGRTDMSETNLLLCGKLRI